MRTLLKQATAEDLASDASIDRYLSESDQAWTYGGNTSCIEVSFDDKVFVLDAGSGLRGLGGQLMVDGRGKSHSLHMFLTHFHWDHICGFPFFGPIYMPEQIINVWSGRSDSERLLKLQMNDAHFPVKWDMLPSNVECNQIPEDTVVEVAGAEVSILPMIHPDKAYGYRINQGGHSVCYLTDTEISKQPELLADKYAAFVEGADVVIVDAMYGFLEYHDHINFGHSTIFNWIDFFRDSKIGELCIFHHDPLASDEDITNLCASAERYRKLIAPNAEWRVTAAKEGGYWDL
ncbi:MAG: MBL fold metallo-hydrolase [Planctomycetes bacterium]|nr:MBL fold metallo-hydrolase [Planctomycetota bacterium]